jgi:hypothetical protein
MYKMIQWGKASFSSPSTFYGQSIKEAEMEWVCSSSISTAAADKTLERSCVGYNRQAVD